MIDWVWVDLRERSSKWFQSNFIVLRYRARTYNSLPAYDSECFWLNLREQMIEKDYKSTDFSQTCSNEIANPSSAFGFFVPESDCDLALGFWYPTEYPPFSFESCDLDPDTWSSLDITWWSGEWFAAVNFCLLGGDSETAFRCRRREGEKTDSSPSGEAVDGSDRHFVKQKTRPGDRPRGTETTKKKYYLKSYSSTGCQI